MRVLTLKDLQFNTRALRPGPGGTNLVFDQYGGENGGLATGMQHFAETFSAKTLQSDKYEMLMDGAMEQFSRLEIKGTTIQILSKSVSGELKSTGKTSEMVQLMNGKAAEGNINHAALMANPQFGIITKGKTDLK